MGMDSPQQDRDRLDAVLSRPATLAHGAQTLSVPDSATLLKAKIRMAMNRLMATYLSNWEETADQHDEAMGKLIDALPADHKASVVLADTFGDTRFEAVRRHVLKSGNDQLRDIDEMIDGLRLHS